MRVKRPTCDIGADLKEVQIAEAMLLNCLIQRATIPEYPVRWNRAPDSVAIGDNRCTQHHAVMDYPPAVRQMQRAGVIGQRPVR